MISKINEGKLGLNISNETFMQINLFARTMIIVPLPIMGL